MMSRFFTLLALGACLLLAVLSPVAAWAEPSPEPLEKPFAVEPGSFRVTPSTFQAGAHENLTTTFDFDHSVTGKTFNDLRSTVVNLPAGFTANSTAVPTCSPAQLLSSGSPASIGTQCPPASQIGTISLNLTFTSTSEPMTFPLYNMEVSSFGVTAELGFKTLILSQLLAVTVRPGDSGITSTSPSIVEIGEPHDVSVEIWGVPASHEHDSERGQVCTLIGFANECYGGGEEAHIPLKPFLSNPTSCEPFSASMKANSWEAPARWSEASG